MLYRLLNRQINITFFILALGLAYTAGSHATGLEAENYDLELYGFIRLDAAYDFDENLGSALQNNYGLIRRPDAPSTLSGHYDMRAGATRLGFNLKSADEINAKLEGDFAGGNLRLRHAYFTWDGFLFGQTWTNFNTMIASPGQLALIGPTGRGGFRRKPQVRYTTDLGSGKFSVSLEEPDGSVFEGIGQHFDGNNREAPDVTLRFKNNAGALTYSIGGVVRQTGYTAPNGVNEHTTGFGISLAGNYHIVATNTSLKASFIYGNGIGNYVSGSPAPIAFVMPNGKLKNIKEFAYVLSVHQKITDRIGGSLAYAFSEADWDEAEDLGIINPTMVNRRRSSVYANVTFNPVKHLLFGLEAERHSVKWQDGAEGHAIRLLFVSEYRF